ncbi:MAG: hypothetical protein AAFX00_01905 [Pseudomonadota bacterium]
MGVVKSLIVIALLGASGPVLAAPAGGAPDPEPVRVCVDGKVYDAETKTCVDPKDSRLDDRQRLDAATRLAEAGQTDQAFAILADVRDKTSDNALTVLGFAHRKAGNMGLAERYYKAAIAQNPDNFLARSYYGLGLLAQGETGAAQAQLSEIRRRGGRGTLAEASLYIALKSGQAKAY